MLCRLNPSQPSFRLIPESQLSPATRPFRIPLGSNYWDGWASEITRASASGSGSVGACFRPRRDAVREVPEQLYDMTREAKLQAEIRANLEWRSSLRGEWEHEHGEEEPDDSTCSGLQGP
jgi:hypothetical protein